MWYSIVSDDVENSLARRSKVRGAHVARLQHLLDEGRLLIAGPNPAIDANDPGSAGYTGSVVIADFASLEEARAWADVDPYMDAGVYRCVTVKPFKLVLP